MSNRNRLPKFTYKSVRKKCGNICYLCGKPIGKYGTIEHLLPLSIPKWTKHPMSLFDDPRNLFYVHRHCNSVKGADVLAERDISYLHLPNRNGFREFYSEQRGIITDYKKLVTAVRRKWNNRCFVCGKPIYKTDSYNLRRIDPDKPRSIKNACIVCSAKCNAIMSKLHH